MCNSCHKKDDDKAHKGKFGPKCETCHVEKDWKEITFDHGKQTKYPLLGKHKDAKCVSCHKGDLYKDKLPSKCVSCHQKEDDKAHKGNFGPEVRVLSRREGLERGCLRSRQADQVPVARQAQDKPSASSCHKGDVYKDKLQTSCLSCHEKDDKHKGQEGKKCESCHSEQSWNKTTFNHGTMSTFPLLGRAPAGGVQEVPRSRRPSRMPSRIAGRATRKRTGHKRRLGSECRDLPQHARLEGVGLRSQQDQLQAGWGAQEDRPQLLCLPQESRWTRKCWCPQPAAVAMTRMTCITAISATVANVATKAVTGSR